MEGSVSNKAAEDARIPESQLLEVANDEAAADEADAPETPVVDLLASTPEVEAQLSVEEEIERRTSSDHTDTPHFRKDAE
jgi:hypothetical protein